MLGQKLIDFKNFFDVNGDTFIISKSLKNFKDAVIQCGIDINNKVELLELRNFMIKFCEDNSIKNISFEEDSELTTIENNMFEGMTFIESIDFSNCKNLEAIGSSAFSECANLKKINFEGCKKLKEINSFAFWKCINLEKVNLYGCDQLKSLGQASFEFCQKLNDFDFTKLLYLEKIGGFAFSNCKELKHFNIANNQTIKTIGKFAFADSGLQDADLSNSSIEDLQMYIFSNCEKLKNIYIRDCKKLKEFNNFSFSDFDKGEEKQYDLIDFRGTNKLYDWNCNDVKLNSKKIIFSYNLDGHGVNPQFNEMFTSETNIEIYDMDKKAFEFKCNEDYGKLRVLSLNNLRICEKLGYDYDVDFISAFTSFKEIKNANQFYEDLNNFVQNQMLDKVSSSYKTNCITLLKILGCFGVSNSQTGEGFNPEEIKIYKNFLARDFIQHKIKIDLDAMREDYKNNFATKYKDINEKRKDYMTNFDIKIQQKAIELSKNYPLEKLIFIFVKNNIVDNAEKEKLFYEIGRMQHKENVDIKFAQFFASHINEIISNKLVKEDLKGIKEDNEEIYPAKDGKIRLYKIYDVFDNILDNNKNKLIITRSDKNRLELEHCESKYLFKNILEGSDELAELCNKVSIKEQNDFDFLQDLFIKGKAIKDNQILKVCEDTTTSKIYYQFIEKDNPIGLVLGNITNCCQCVGGKGESCMVCGQTEPNSGFITINYKDEIIGQAWVWYSEKDKTIALDNIEVPETYQKKLTKNYKNEILDCIQRLSNNLYVTMSNNGYKVDNIIIGSANTDILGLDEKYYLEKDCDKMIGIPFKSEDKQIYTDILSKGQYVIYRDGKSYHPNKNSILENKGVI